MLRFASISFIAQTSSFQTIAFKLKSPISVFPSASNSAILALASFLTWKNPNLLPEESTIQIPQILQRYQKEENFPSPSLSLHPFFEIWSDRLCQAIFDGDARREENTLYIGIKVSVTFFSQLTTEDWEVQFFQGKTGIEQIFNLKIKEVSEKRICLLNLAISQLRTDKLQPKINVPALLLGTIFNNEKWKIYCVLQGQIPSQNELSQFDSIILPGSTNSILDDVPQINIFMERLRNVLEKQNKLNVLGICYGHQFISNLFQAPIERKKRFKGLQNVQFDNSIIRDYKFLQPLLPIMQQKTLFSEYHEDYVEGIPEGFRLLGSSQSSNVEALVSENGKFLSFQFHPEYFSEYTISYALRAEVYNCDLIKNFGLVVEKEEEQTHHESSEAIRECISLFIRQ